MESISGFDIFFDAANVRKFSFLSEKSARKSAPLYLSARN